MSCTSYKIRQNCKKSYATCVEYEGDIPDYSDLSDSGCVDMEQVTEDIYSLITEIKENSDLESLRDGCIDYEAGEITTKTALENIQNFICTMQTTITALTSRVSTLEAQVQQLQEDQCP